jgi:SAM-dependent methyltransferase
LTKHFENLKRYLDAWEVKSPMIKIHEANRRLWNNQATTWEKRLNRDGRWRRCHKEPELAFEGETLATIREMVGDLRDKQVCVIGSGDNMAAYALSGLGAVVTSTDISEERLNLAASRAEVLGVSIDFVRCDAADLGFADDSTFDLVCSTNGFFVWIADLGGVFREVSRILKAGGAYVFYDIHPFMRPWKEQVMPIEMKKSYWDTGPFRESANESYTFNWTLADLLNPLAQAGLTLKKVVESPTQDSGFWQGSGDTSDIDESLLDWRRNPRAGLPVWLTVAASRID